MKNNPSTILIFGHDEHLLVTRQWVLQSRGYRVLRAGRASEILTIPEKPAIAVLLLCYSLSPRESAWAREAAPIRWPGIQCMSLAAERSNIPSGILGQLLHTLDGPDRLLTAVGELAARAARFQEGMRAAENPAA